MTSLPELFGISTKRVRLSWAGIPVALSEGTLIVRHAPLVDDVEVRIRSSVRPKGLEVGPALGEDREYVVWIEAEKGVLSLRHRDPRIGTSLSTREGGRVLHGTVNFRSAAGLSDFEVLLDGKLALAFSVEIFPTKLDYRADFAEMLADVQAVCTGLAIDLLSATYMPASVLKRRSRTSGQEWVAILEAMLDELVLAFRQIERAPIWTLEHEPAHIPLHKLRRASPAVSTAVARRGLAWLHGEQLRFECRGRVEAQLPHPNLDGPEHRWLRQRLRLVTRRLGEMRDALSSPGREMSPRVAAVREHLDRIAKRVAPLLEIEPLVNVGGGIAPSFASLPLMTKPGYREAYAVLGMLDKGLVLDGPPLRADLRDIASLYEYWCFISLVRMAQQILGAAPIDQSLVRLASKGIRVDLEKGRSSAVRFRREDGLSVELVYNRQFQASTAVLFDQRPDVVITLRDGVNDELNLVVDAKYRVEKVESVRRFGMVAPPEDAINALYRYRDAIVRESKDRTVVEAVAAFPANASESVGFATSKLGQAIDAFGVGAIPFLPGNEEPMENWLRSAMRRAGWETAQRNPGHVAEILTAEEEALGRRIALIDVPSADHRAARFEFFRAGWHYIPLSPGGVTGSELSRAQRRRLSAGAIALFDGKAVNLVAEVIGVSIVPRAKIPTPYPSRLPGDTLCILYELGAASALKPPVPATSPVTRPRWTSMLSLRLAKSTDELLVETVDEWRLLRALRSRGVNPALLRETVNEHQTGGHVSFRVAPWRVRQASSGRWSVEMGVQSSDARDVEGVLEIIGLAASCAPDEGSIPKNRH